MARGLATRCSACGTVFRVVTDQLRVSEGWVRCGRCAQVFNALEGLVDLETGLPQPTGVGAVAGVGAGVGAGAGAGTGAGLAPQVAIYSDEDYEIAQPAARPGGPPLSGAPSALAPPGPANWLTAGGGGSGTSNGSSGKTSSRPGFLARPSQDAEPEPEPLPETEAEHWPRPDIELGSRPAADDLAAAVAEASDSELEPHSAPAVAPSFVRHAERAARWQQPRVRLLLALGAAAAALSLAAQIGLQYRDLLAARWPASRPLLVQACQVLGCQVEAARSIDGLAVESSGLVRVERSELYRLQVTLRNRAGIELAVPALDVTLSDAQGRLVARKVMRLAELGAPQATIAAGRELGVLATLQAVAGTEAAQQPIAGYTIELFYP